MTDEDWQLDGVCRSVDPELWFPDQGASAIPAKRICVTCPIRQRCLDQALAQDERWGVWGGFSERERRKLKLGIKIELIEEQRGKTVRACKVCDAPVTHHAAAIYCSPKCSRRAEYNRRNDSRREARSAA